MNESVRFSTWTLAILSALGFAILVFFVLAVTRVLLCIPNGAEDAGGTLSEFIDQLKRR
jgi:hypothetical protein